MVDNASKIIANLFAYFRYKSILLIKEHGIEVCIFSKNLSSVYLCIEQIFVCSLPALLCLLLCLAVGSAIPDVGCDELVFPPKCMAFIPSNIFSFFSLDKGRPWTMAASLFTAAEGLDIFLFSQVSKSLSQYVFVVDLVFRPFHRNYCNILS
jgi:hypothetical protein